MNIVGTWSLEEMTNSRKVVTHMWQELLLEHLPPNQPFTLPWLVQKTGKQHLQTERLINRPGFVEILSDGIERVYLYQQEFFDEAQKQGMLYYPYTLIPLLDKTWPQTAYMDKAAITELNPLKREKVYKPRTKAKEIPTQAELNILEDKNVQKIVISVLEHSNVSTLIKVINHVYETETQFHNSP